jgi:hypothetical protein
VLLRIGTRFRRRRDRPHVGGPHGITVEHYAGDHDTVADIGWWSES